MRAILPLAFSALLLAGCQSAEEKRAAETGEIDVTNGSMADVSKLVKAARAKTQMQPGIWHTQMEISSIDLSGLPEDQREAQMEAIARQSREKTSCRSAKQIKPIDFEQIEKTAGQCSFPRFVQSGGKIDAEISCQQASGPVTKIVAKGTTAPDRFDVTLDQSTGKPGEAGYVALTIKAKGQRQGACEAKEEGEG